MAAPDFEKMSVDELIQYKTGIKEKMAALREEVQSAATVFNRKVEESHVAEAKKQLQILADKNGRTLIEEAEYWQGRLTDNGDTGRWVQSNLVLGKPGKVLR